MKIKSFTKEWRYGQAWGLSYTKENKIKCILIPNPNWSRLNRKQLYLPFTTKINNKKIEINLCLTYVPATNKKIIKVSPTLEI